MKADLENLTNGRAESDEADAHEDGGTLSCSVVNDKGSVEFSLGLAPS